MHIAQFRGYFFHIDCLSLSTAKKSSPCTKSDISNYTYKCIGKIATSCVFIFQMISTADRIITNVVAKWPGAVHDSRIFRESNVSRQLNTGKLYPRPPTLNENECVMFVVMFFLYACILFYIRTLRRISSGGQWIRLHENRLNTISCPCYTQ